MSREVIGRRQLKLADGTFARASAAYDFDATSETLVERAVDAPLTRTVLRCNRANPRIVENEGGSGVHIAPVCDNGRYLFGIAGTTLYRNATGGTTASDWDSLGDLGSIRALWAMSNGNLILAQHGTGGETGYTIISYSTDDGETWTRSQGPSPVNGPMAFLTENAIVDWFSFAEGEGVGILAEYSIPPNTGRYLYRTADYGVTFGHALDAETLQPGGITHWHAVGYHAALRRWLAAAGDDDKRFMAYSDNGGLTWARLTTTQTPQLQPVDLCDYGHPTRMGFGSDALWECGTLNVDGDDSDDRDIRRVVDWDRNVYPGVHNSTKYCFRVQRVGGVYYAVSWLNKIAPTPCYVSVSGDFERWTTYCTLPQYSGAHATGVAAAISLRGGLIHMAAYYSGKTVLRHVVLEPARLSAQTAWLVQPASTNILPANDANGTDATTNWLTPSGSPTKQVDSTQSVTPSDTNCVRIAKADGDAGIGFKVHYASGFVEGDALQFGWYVKGRMQRQTWRWTNYAYSSLDGNQHVISVWTSPTGAGGWHYHQLVPCIAPAMHGTPSNQHVRLYGVLSRCYGGYDTDVRYDGLKVAVNEPPTTWVPGGATRAADALSYSANADTSWTHLVALETPNATYDLRPTANAGKLGPLHLYSIYREWVEGAGTIAEVYYDPSDSTFALALTDDDGEGGGDGTTVIKTDAVAFGRDTPIVVAVRRVGGTTGAAFTLSVLANGTLYHSTASAPEGSVSPIYGPVTIANGDKDGAKQLPMLVSDDNWLYNGALSDEQLAARMERALFAQSDLPVGEQNILRL